MSIEINVELPGDQHRHLSIVRQGPLRDGFGTYKVYLRGTGNLVTTFRHRYADGWMACVARAMTQLDHKMVMDL